MPKQNDPPAWERVLVRHVVAAKRQGLSRLRGLLRTPFPTHGGSTRPDLDPQPPRGRWLVAPCFARESWVPLLSNAAGAPDLFAANAASRRLEVAWVGCDPGGVGWFVRVHRAGQPAVDFAHPVGVSAADHQAGAQAFRAQCVAADVAVPARQVRVIDRQFVVLGARGKPVRPGLRGAIVLSGPPLVRRENAAADALARAIQQGDPAAIRAAIARGAPLTVLPDTTSPPIWAMFDRCQWCDPARWAACLDVLLAAGCSILDGPEGRQPMVDALGFAPEPVALRKVRWLLAHGAAINATDAEGRTALTEAVVHQYVRLTRFLLDHGADRAVLHPEGIPLAAWVENEIRTIRARLATAPPDPPEHQTIASMVLGILSAPQGQPAARRYARILELLIGQPDQPPQAEPSLNHPE